MSDSHFSAIEARTGFRAPELFRQLVSAGLTQYGATREEWKRTWKQRMLDLFVAFLTTTDEQIRDLRPRSPPETTRIQLGLTPDTVATGAPADFEPGPNPTARQRGDETDQN